MNYFFALELPDKVRDDLADQVSRWRSELDQMYPYRWTNLQDYHITLKFLGDLSDAALQRAIESAWSIAMAQQSFRVRLARAGSFKPHSVANAVLWMGVRHNPDLVELVQTLDVSVPNPHWIVSAGQTHAQSQQEYKPHITLARGNFPPEYFGYRLDYERPFPFWEANQFVLMQTLPPEQRANGAKARYNTVQTFPFGNVHS